MRRPLLEYGRTLAAAGRDEEAEPAFEQALKLNPNPPGAAADLAMSLQRMGRQQDAIPWFEKALAAEPRNVSVLTNLGLALTLTGKAKEASGLLRARAGGKPKGRYASSRIAALHTFSYRRSTKRFRISKPRSRSIPTIRKFTTTSGWPTNSKTGFEESIAELKQAGEMDPKLEDPPYTLGITYMQMGKLDEAVVELRKAVALRADNGNAWAILGSTLKQNGKLDEAAEALEKAIPLQPGQPGPLVTLAGVLSEQAAEFIHRRPRPPMPPVTRRKPSNCATG